MSLLKWNPIWKDHVFVFKVRIYFLLLLTSNFLRNCWKLTKLSVLALQITYPVNRFFFFLGSIYHLVFLSSLKDSDAGKDWGKEKGMTEDEMVGCHHWLNGHESEQTLGDREGQRSLVSMRFQRDGHDWATEQPQSSKIFVLRHVRQKATKSFDIILTVF